MNKFTTHTGLAVPLYQPNVDTDQIIPKQFLKSIKRTGFGANLFNDWRFFNDGTINPDFVLNLQRYKGASILLSGENFGCGSSREHAPWALAEFGFRVVIAPSFADIFYSNSLKTGLLPITLNQAKVVELVRRCEEAEGYKITIDLENSRISDDTGFAETFKIEDFYRFCLLNGLDNIDLILQHETKISAFEAEYKANYPTIAA
jgi:3-isopropylmalate/(R)-2-methylmalate dehydratase small subunit